MLTVRHLASLFGVVVGVTVFAVAAAADADSVGKGYVSAEERLRAKLTENSSGKNTLPKNATGPGSEAINVAVGLYFYSLDKLDDLSGTASLSIWQRFSWKDRNLVWNASDYGEECIRFHPAAPNNTSLGPGGIC